MSDKQKLKSITKRIRKAIDDDEEDYCMMQGEISKILSLITISIKNVIEEGVPKEAVKECIELAFLDEKELLEKTKQALQEMLNKGE